MTWHYLRQYRDVTSARSCNNVGHMFWFTILEQHETNDVILYIHSVHKHRGNSFQRQIYIDCIPQAFLSFRFVDTIVWPFLECRPSKLYFKILWKYDDWSFRFHHFLENGRFYRENTYKCSPFVTKWQIILHFHCCFNNKYTPDFLG